MISISIHWSVHRDFILFDNLTVMLLHRLSSLIHAPLICLLNQYLSFSFILFQLIVSVNNFGGHEFCLTLSCSVLGNIECLTHNLLLNGRLPLELDTINALHLHINVEGPL